MRFGLTFTLVGVLLTGCARATTAPASIPGVPGFDARDYPGDVAMRRWFEASPYRWVGYYLPSPCYTGTTWRGKRAQVREIGYGFALIYVGEQDWAASRIMQSSTVVEFMPPRCTRANVTAAKGAIDGGAAMTAAAADGFPEGTVIHLDVEHVVLVSAAQLEYVRAWTRALLDSGRFTPGLYAHEANVPDLYIVLADEFERAGRRDRPSLWVARAAGFDTQRSPTASGFPVASVWQGIFDTHETWAGTTLQIDVNVALTADPSRGR